MIDRSTRWESPWIKSWVPFLYYKITEWTFESDIGSCSGGGTRYRFFLTPPPKHIEPLVVPAPLQFDWLRDYGPLWEPGSTAFWLEPETEAELAAWKSKYEAPRAKDYIDVRRRQQNNLGLLAQAQMQQSMYAQGMLNQRYEQQLHSSVFNALFGIRGF